jgi:hypothetical protein
MMCERRAPAVQYGHEADADTEAFRVGGNSDQGLGRELEQQVVRGDAPNGLDLGPVSGHSGGKVGRSYNVSHSTISRL